MLELKNITFTVSGENGDVDILKDVSLTIEDKKFVVITGPNGGGKTTLAKVIMGLVQPTSGKIFWNGEDITDLSISQRAQKGISYGFQQPPRFKGMKVSDLLQIAAGKKLNHDEACSFLTKVGLCARDDVDRSLLAAALATLSDRERQIITMRFGLGGGEERTQKEVADRLGISQSYISRLEKRIITRLKKEILRLS